MDSCKIYTPAPIAQSLVAALGDHVDAKWLEPSFGKGAFIEALSRVGVPRERVRGIDLDKKPEEIDSCATVQRGADFLAWSIATDERFDRIVGNPPYITVSKLPENIRDATRRVPLPTEESRPNGTSNLWFFFICASLRLLKDGGGIGFVLPAAWEYADYASSLRSYLKGNFRENYVVRSKSPLFPDVQEGSVILVAQGYKQKPKDNVRIECSNSDGVLQALSSLKQAGAHDPALSCAIVPEKIETLGDYLHIGIGAVTGDSAFFLMTESERNGLSLPVSAMRAVLTRSRQLTSPVISNREWQLLKDSGERIWLFRPPMRLLKHRAVRRYMELSSDDGGCNRDASHIVRRPKWFSTLLPRSVHGFISGMSTIGPWIAHNQTSNLCATNTLYTVTFRRSLTKSDRYAVSLALMASQARDQLDSNCRVYADGLRKHEPKDILSIQVRMPSQRRGVKGTYIRAAQELIKGNAAKAQNIADKFIRG